MQLDKPRKPETRKIDKLSSVDFSLNLHPSYFHPSCLRLCASLPSPIN